MGYKSDAPYMMYGKKSSKLEGGSPLAKYGCSKRHSPLKTKGGGDKKKDEVISDEEAAKINKKREKLEAKAAEKGWSTKKQLKKGDNIVLSAFGGGFTWGAVYLKWAYNS